MDKSISEEYLKALEGYSKSFRGTGIEEGEIVRSLKKYLTGLSGDPKKLSESLRIQEQEIPSYIIGTDCSCFKVKPQLAPSTGGNEEDPYKCSFLPAFRGSLDEVTIIDRRYEFATPDPERPVVAARHGMERILVFGYDPSARSAFICCTQEPSSRRVHPVEDRHVVSALREFGRTNKYSGEASLDITILGTTVFRMRDVEEALKQPPEGVGIGSVRRVSLDGRREVIGIDSRDGRIYRIPQE